MYIFFLPKGNPEVYETYVSRDPGATGWESNKMQID